MVATTDATITACSSRQVRGLLNQIRQAIQVRHRGFHVALRINRRSRRMVLADLLFELFDASAVVVICVSDRCTLRRCLGRVRVNVQ